MVGGSSESTSSKASLGNTTKPYLKNKQQTEVNSGRKMITGGERCSQEYT